MNAFSVKRIALATAILGMLLAGFQDCCAFAAPTSPLPVKLSTGFLFDDNVGYAFRPKDRFADGAIETTVAFSRSMQIDRWSALTGSLQFGERIHDDFAGLNRFSAGLDLRFQRKMGLGSNALRAILSASWSDIRHKDGDWNRNSLQVGLHLRKKIGRRTDLRLSADYETGAGRETIFNQNALTYSAGTGIQISPASILLLGYAHRDGDFTGNFGGCVSFWTIGRCNGTFGVPMTFYRSEGKTRIWSARMAYALSDKSSLNVGYSEAVTRRHARRSIAKYPVNKLTVDYLRNL